MTDPVNFGPSTDKTVQAALLVLANDAAMLEVGRRAIEDELIEWRDLRLSVMRNNGLVIRESDGSPSDVIRMGPEDALRIGLRAIAAALTGASDPAQQDKETP